MKTSVMLRSCSRGERRGRGDGRHSLFVTDRLRLLSIGDDAFLFSY